jgi:hypothetical protein
MNRRRRLATIALLVSVVALGCHNWRGPGIRARGPEMPRLRHELTLAPGMSVADVGAGRGEMTVALAAEIGPSGRALATPIVLTGPSCPRSRFELPTRDLPRRGNDFALIPG